MKILSLMGLLAGLFLGAPAQANPAGDRVRLLYVFTPAAKTTIGNDAAIKAWINTQTGTASTTSTTWSGGDTRYQVTTNSNGVIQYNDTQPCCGAGSQNGNAVSAASKNIPIAELRDKYDADVVVVVTSAASDSDLSSSMDCSKSGAAAAKTAFVGVSIYGEATGTAVEARIMAALGKAQCAGEADSYAFMEGFNSNNCTLYRTLLDQTTSLTRDVWIVPENGLASPAGYSDVGPDNANVQMASLCNGFTAGVFTYTCAATGSCSAPGGFQFCTHNRTQTDTRGLPTCTPGSSGPGGCITIQNIQSPWSKNNFTCTGSGTSSYSVNLGTLSNPNKFYHGIAMGSSLKNAVGKMNARFAEAKAYYQTKLAPRLKVASGVTE